MHILMMASEFCLKHMTFPRPWPYDYPGVTRPDLGGLRGGRSFFEELRLGEAPPLGGEAAWAAWQAELWPARADRAPAAPPGQDELHGHEARVYGARDGELSRRSKRFALLSPDALWDAEIGGWRLEEINTNGLFQLGADEGEDVRTFHVDEGYTEAWLQIAGVDGYPRAGLAAALDAALDDFCAGRGCDGRDREVLAAAAHENAHASSGWAATRAGRLHFDFLRSLDRAYFASPSAARPDDGDRDGFPRYVDPER
ncbi:hypothetical protein JL722_14759 [Aureococcus anophagefferens]|nr:hypothetical protein JL722_14759 [Aureococcus anophagefferens]